MALENQEKAFRRVLFQAVQLAFQRLEMESKKCVDQTQYFGAFCLAECPIYELKWAFCHSRIITMYLELFLVIIRYSTMTF